MVRSVVTASRTGADTYTATEAKLARSAAVQFINADATAQATMHARSAFAASPRRASPRPSTEKMIIATSRASAWITAAALCCLTVKMNRSCAANTTYSRPASKRPRRTIPAETRPAPGWPGRRGRASRPGARRSRRDKLVITGPVSVSYWSRPRPRRQRRHAGVSGVVVCGMLSAVTRRAPFGVSKLG